MEEPQYLALFVQVCVCKVLAGSPKPPAHPVTEVHPSLLSRSYLIVWETQSASGKWKWWDKLLAIYSSQEKSTKRTNRSHTITDKYTQGFTMYLNNGGLKRQPSWNQTCTCTRDVITDPPRLNSADSPIWLYILKAMSNCRMTSMNWNQGLISLLGRGMWTEKTMLLASIILAMASSKSRILSHWFGPQGMNHFRPWWYPFWLSTHLVAR